MAERRSLATAVSTPVPGVDPDTVRSFVTQNTVSERPIAETARLSEELRPRAREVLNSSPASESKSEAISATSCVRSARTSRFQPIGLIPVTVRLKPEIAGALKRASLERELEGEEVFTQQDLVEQALEPWLQGQGYL